MLKLEWRPRAQLDRESIAVYLGIERGNPKAALATIKQIDAAIDRVRELPDSGGRCRFEGLERKEYRLVHVGHYTVYYRFNEETLTVVRILHQRQDLNEYAFIDSLLSL